jgi:hypothetical protein
VAVSYEHHYSPRYACYVRWTVAKSDGVTVYLYHAFEDRSMAWTWAVTDGVHMELHGEIGEHSADYDAAHAFIDGHMNQ